MNNKIALSIAITSLASITTVSLPAHATEAPAAPQASAKPKSGGKCAAGKCGTEKIYAKVDPTGNPQDRLVRTRDGKCGLSGKGYDVKLTPAGKRAEGICGQ